MAFCCCWGCNSQGNFSCFPDPRRSRKSWQLTKASFALVNWMNWVETNWEAVIPFVTMFLRQQCLNGQKSSRKGWMGISSYSCMKKKKIKRTVVPLMWYSWGRFEGIHLPFVSTPIPCMGMGGLLCGGLCSIMCYTWAASFFCLYLEQSKFHLPPHSESRGWTAESRLGLISATDCKML